MSSPPEAPPIESKLVFERIESISSALNMFNIENHIIPNAFSEPVGVYVPEVLTPEAAAYHAEIIKITKISQQQDPTWRPNQVIRELAAHYPINPYSATPYPGKMHAVIDIAMLALRTNISQTVTDYQSEETRGGDSVPHIDYMALGDVALRPDIPINDGPNIHLSLERSAVVQLGQVRYRSWVETIREGIEQAKANGMDEVARNNNLTINDIRRNADPRVPDSLKRGIGYIDESLSQGSPPVILHPGDVCIFQSHLRGNILPSAHNFRTIAEAGKEDLPRTFTVFRPRLADKFIEDGRRYELYMQAKLQNLFLG